MRLSNYFLPTLKEDPREAQVASHRLMLRAGMIRQLSSGIYNFLPLGLRVLRNVERIIREELNKAGCLELLMPTMQPAELWQESGRGDYGKETLIATDRHDNKLIYGPTNEEVITDLFRRNITSYKSLPLNFYHTQWKFRDEIRPRFGLMRGREFYMKDGYSFASSEEEAKGIYFQMFTVYLRIFKRLGLKAIPFKADTGQIGGELSHEFQILAKTGESEIFYDKEFEALIDSDNEFNIEKMLELYARTEDLHDAENCPVEAANLVSKRGIEVGHIFYLADKYSKAMKAEITTKEGTKINPLMGCYGIGISRIVAAAIEANHDEKGIIWPQQIAPFKLAIINVKPKDESISKVCDDLYRQASELYPDAILYDDRDESLGKKFSDIELIGIPFYLSVGSRTMEDGIVEIKCRRHGEVTKVSIDKLIEHISNIF